MQQKTKILQKIGDKVFNNKTQRERGTIIAIGKMVARAMDIGQRLQEKMDVEVINARFLKPLDNNTIIESIKKTKNVITIEDGTIINGLATAVKELIVNNNLQGVKIKSYAYPDEFIKHGSVDELEKIYGLDAENIVKNCVQILEKIYDKSIYLLIAIIFMYIGFKLTNLYIKHLKKDKLLKIEPTAKNFIINIINITE